MSVFSQAYERRQGILGMTAVIDILEWQAERKAKHKFFGPAQIIMFTGVRFERLVDTPSEQSPRRRAHRSNQATAEKLE